MMIRGMSESHHRYEFNVYRKCRFCGETIIEKDRQTTSLHNFKAAIQDYQRGYDKHALHICSDGKLGITDIIGYEELKP